jgi:hypothetical protein
MRHAIPGRRVAASPRRRFGLICSQCVPVSPRIRVSLAYIADDRHAVE